MAASKTYGLRSPMHEVHVNFIVCEAIQPYGTNWNMYFIER